MCREDPRLSVTPTTVLKEQNIGINLNGLELGCQVLSGTPKGKAAKGMMANWTPSQIIAIAVAAAGEAQSHQRD